MLKLHFENDWAYEPTEIQFETFKEATDYVLSDEHEFHFHDAFLVCNQTLSEYKFNFENEIWEELK